MAEHNKIGEAGEAIAANYLKKADYEILQRNWHFKKAELDIIAAKDQTLVVVEVKARNLNAVERPQDAVTPAKQKRIVTAADAYIQENDIEWECRFDVISVIFKGTQYELEHLEDAFQAGL